MYSVSPSWYHMRGLSLSDLEHGFKSAYTFSNSAALYGFILKQSLASIIMGSQY